MFTTLVLPVADSTVFTTLLLSVLLADAPPTAAFVYYRPSGAMYDSPEALQKNAPDLIRRTWRHAAKELAGRFDLSTQERWEQFLKRHVSVRAVGTTLILVQARDLSPADGALVVNAAAEGYRLCQLEYSQMANASKEYHVRALRETVNKAERKLLLCFRGVVRDSLSCCAASRCICQP